MTMIKFIRKIAAGGYYDELNTFFNQLYTNGDITLEEYRNYKKNKWKMLAIQFLSFAIMLIFSILAGIAYLVKYTFENVSPEDTAFLILTMGIGIMLLSLFYTFPIGFICKSGRRMADIRQLYKTEELYDSDSIPIIKGIINGEMDRPISFKEWRTTIILFLIPILIVAPDTIGAEIRARQERIRFEKELEQQLEENAATETGNLTAVISTLKNDFKDEDIYYYIAGEKEYSEDDLMLVVILGNENTGDVLFAHFPVKDDSVYSLEYFVSKYNDLSVEEVKKKANGKL